MQEPRPPQQPIAGPEPVRPHRSWWSRLPMQRRAFIIGMGLIAAPIIYVAVVGALAHHDTGNGAAPTSDSAASGQSSLPTNLHWVSYKDPSTGFTYEMAVTKVHVTTTAASPNDPAVPQGQAYLSADIEIKNTSNGQIGVPSAWYFGVSAADDPNNCGAEINNTNQATQAYTPIIGRPGYCWESTNYLDPRQGFNVTNVPLDGGQTVTGQIKDEWADMISSKAKAQDIIVGFGSPTADMLTLPQP